MRFLFLFTAILVYGNLAQASTCESNESLCDFLNQYQKEGLDQSWESGSDAWVRDLWRNRKFTGGKYGDYNAFPMLSRFQSSQKVREATSDLNSLVGIVPEEEIKFLSSLYAYDIYTSTTGSEVLLTNSKQERNLLNHLKTEVIPCLKNSNLSECRSLENQGILQRKGERYLLSEDVKARSIKPTELSLKLDQLKQMKKEKQEMERRERIAKHQEEQKKKPKSTGRNSSSQEPSSACYVVPKKDKCSTSDYKKIRASASFKASYRRKYGDVKKKLSAYCRAGIESEKSKATIKPPHFIKRNLMMSGNSFPFYGCKADFVPGEKRSCVENLETYAKKNGESNVMPLPFWPVGSSLAGFETWTGLDFWDMQANGKINCDTTSKGLENYFAWACVAENGFPNCFEKKSGFSLPFINSNSR